MEGLVLRAVGWGDVLVSAHVHVSLYVYMCAHACGGQRSMSCVSVALHLHFEDRDSQSAWSSLIPASGYLFSTGIAAAAMPSLFI